jgi:transcription elongation factor Elf1
MGRRKKKKNQKYRPAKVLPKIFKCPKCSHKTLKPKKPKPDDTIITFECGFCKFTESGKKLSIGEAVDAYGDLIDIYYREQEWDRLNEKAQRLKETEQYTELSNVYSYLSNIANIYYEKTMQEFEKLGLPQLEEDAKNWLFKRDALKQQEKEILAKLRSGELVEKQDTSVHQEGQEIVTIGENVLVEEPSKPKKEANLREVLGDLGFLEFDEEEE